MPFIHFTNVESSIVKQFSEEKIEEFSKISSAPYENIHIVCNDNIIVNHKEYVYIKIEWMPREANIEELVVKLINDFMKQFDFKKVSINFIHIDSKHYYVNNI